MLNGKAGMLHVLSAVSAINSIAPKYIRLMNAPDGRSILSVAEHLIREATTLVDLPIDSMQEPFGPRIPVPESVMRMGGRFVSAR